MKSEYRGYLRALVDMDNWYIENSPSLSGDRSLFMWKEDSAPIGDAESELELLEKELSDSIKILRKLVDNYDLILGEGITPHTLRKIYTEANYFLKSIEDKNE